LFQTLRRRTDRRKGPQNAFLQGMACEEKIRLTTQYSSNTLAFSHAVTELHQKAGTHTKEEFTQLQRVADELRLKCEMARLALERHAAAHGC
jgi:hypothetical protein